MEPRPKVRIIEPIQKQEASTVALSERKLKVAAYARVSTEQDEQESSYEAQIDYYTQYIKSNPEWEFVAVFADRGITGTNTKNREEFNKMVNLAMIGGINLILTKSISRFARNTVDTLRIVRKLKAVGVEVVFEKENLRTFDPKCEVMLTIMSSLAQEESRSISENIRWGHQKSMRDGKVSLPYSHFLGYRKGEDGRPEIVEEEAKIVLGIYSDFLLGYTIRQIADNLTARGISTPAGNKRWSVSTINSILSNEKYKGDALLQKTYTVDYLTKEKRKNNGELRQYLVEHSHDPIVDAETFDRVQKKLAEHQRRARIRSRSPFAGKIFCADCGMFYGHKVWHNRANTERYDVWYCNHKYEGESVCRTPVLREKDIIFAFETMQRKRGVANTSYSEKRWREAVEKVTVARDQSMTFLLTDGSEIRIEP